MEKRSRRVRMDYDRFQKNWSFIIFKAYVDKDDSTFLLTLRNGFHDNTRKLETTFIDRSTN